MTDWRCLMHWRARRSDLVEEQAARRPNALALTAGLRRRGRPAPELRAIVMAREQARRGPLQGLGIARGDHVGLMLNNESASKPA